MDRPSSAESLVGGLALVAVATVGWCLKALLAPWFLDADALRQATSADWYLFVTATVGVFHLLEGLGLLLLGHAHRLLRRVRTARLCRLPFPDALAEPDPTPREWSRPVACPRCGCIRPASAGRCPHCCPTWT